MNKLLWMILTVCSYFFLAATDIGILMYHNINDKKDRYSVTPEVFRTQLEKLYNAGYVTVPLRDVIAKRKNISRINRQSCFALMEKT